MENIDILIEKLYEKDANEAFKTFQMLEEESKKSNAVYQYFDLFLEMINNINSYVRTRGLFLISANAKWDSLHKIDDHIEQILCHIIDDKPTVSRQFIQSLPSIIQYKSNLAPIIYNKLQSADVSMYKKSMQLLVIKDINYVLSQK